MLEPTVDDLVGAVAEANRAVFERSWRTPSCRDGHDAVRDRPGRRDEGERIAIVNVGDSRVYLLNDGELNQLTEDHTLVEEMVRDGQLTPDEAAVHPQRNVLTGRSASTPR